ncbi:MAG TPA: HXXEE domain-containing protein [Solirubrobacter sp.]|nr:HXXEE domain-containing protein [Solirubrobacter sp.]
MKLETHGRWPLVAAAAVAPVSIAAARRPELRPLAAMLLHETEEWVWPGGFLPWMNREVLGSDEDEFPLDRRLGLVINVGLGWGASLGTIAGPRAAAPSALLYVTHLGNAALHLQWAARHRRYDPGAVTAALTLLPVAVTGLRALHRDPEVSRRALTMGAVAGAAISVALPPLLSRRSRSPG